MHRTLHFCLLLETQRKPGKETMYFMQHDQYAPGVTNTKRNKVVGTCLLWRSGKTLTSATEARNCRSAGLASASASAWSAWFFLDHGLTIIGFHSSWGCNSETQASTRGACVVQGLQHQNKAKISSKFSTKQTKFERERERARLTYDVHVKSVVKDIPSLELSWTSASELGHSSSTWDRETN